MKVREFGESGECGQRNVQYMLIIRACYLNHRCLSLGSDDILRVHLDRVTNILVITMNSAQHHRSIDLPKQRFGRESTGTSNLERNEMLSNCSGYPRPMEQPTCHTSGVPPLEYRDLAPQEAFRQ